MQWRLLKAIWRNSFANTSAWYSEDMLWSGYIAEIFLERTKGLLGINCLEQGRINGDSKDEVFYRIVLELLLVVLLLISEIGVYIG